MFESQDSSRVQSEKQSRLSPTLLFALLVSIATLPLFAWPATAIPCPVSLPTPGFSPATDICGGPGGGGGGGPPPPPPPPPFSCNSYLSYASNKIEGCVVNSDTGNPVSGLTVVIVTCGGYLSTDYITTDSNGHFSFQGKKIPVCISPYSPYPVSVNGVTPITYGTGCYPLPSPCKVVGVSAYAPNWGQWAGDVLTDGNGYGSRVINLTPARTVIVPAASLYSNTQFATLGYQIVTSTSISHTIDVKVKVGSASPVQGSYGSTFSMTYSYAFTVPPNHKEYIGRPYYAIGYYCAGSTSYSGYDWSCSPGLQTAGVTEPVPATTWGSYSLYGDPADPYSLPPGTYCDTNQAPGSQTITYTQAGATSATLTLTSGISLFGIGVTLSYSVKVTSGTSNTITVTINNTTGQDLVFRIHYVGGSCSNPTSELHVWDMSGLG